MFLRCDVCQEMIYSILLLEKEYKDVINFVALNVENSKWTPELLEYHVDGIPHFIFLDQSQVLKGELTGKIPENILKGKIIEFE